MVKQIQTLTQKEAGFAKKCVYSAKTKDYAVEYKRLAKRIPVMVLNNGLGQALAFLKSLERESSPNAAAAKVIYADIDKWLTKECGVFKSDVLGEIYKSDASTYMRAQSSTLSLLGWLKRFSEAFILDKEDSD